MLRTSSAPQLFVQHLPTKRPTSTNSGPERGPRWSLTGGSAGSFQRAPNRPTSRGSLSSSTSPLGGSLSPYHFTLKSADGALGMRGTRRSGFVTDEKLSSDARFSKSGSPYSTSDSSTSASSCGRTPSILDTLTSTSLGRLAAVGAASASTEAGL